MPLAAIPAFAAGDGVPYLDAEGVTRYADNMTGITSNSGIVIATGGTDAADINSLTLTLNVDKITENTKTTETAEEIKTEKPLNEIIL